MPQVGQDREHAAVVVRLGWQPEPGEDASHVALDGGDGDHERIGDPLV
jgi:hypothetical protein